MEYRTILVNETPGIVTVTINRLEKRNSINLEFLKELNQALDKAERDPACKMVVLQGQQGFFCTGMDFEAALDMEGECAGNDPSMRSLPGFQYIETIRRLTSIPKIVLARVDGQAMAGGIGLVAGSDLAISTPRSQFSLSEALWGLLPAMVLPYLIRRVGYQVAYRMTITTLPMSPPEALAVHLVDEVCEDPDIRIRQWWQRIKRLEIGTLGAIKQYFQKMWIITDQMEELAVLETSRRMADAGVRSNIRNFIDQGKFPWED